MTNLLTEDQEISGTYNKASLESKSLISTPRLPTSTIQNHLFKFTLIILRIGFEGFWLHVNVKVKIQIQDM